MHEPARGAGLGDPPTAAAELEFESPIAEQRRAVLQAALAGAGLSAADLDRLMEMTGPALDRAYSYTYGDLRMRIIPAAVLAPYPGHALTSQLLAAQIGANPPTAAFETL